MASALSPSVTDAAALQARRDMLGDFVAAVSHAVQAFGMPASYRDAERATRAITIGDRVLQRVAVLEDAGDDAHAPRPARAARLAFRDLADQVMARTQALPMPRNFLESERAFRYALSADRMLSQLYLPPKPARRLAGIIARADDICAANPSPELDDDLDSWVHGLEDTLRDLATHGKAQPIPAPQDPAPAETTPATPSLAPSTIPAPAPAFMTPPRLSRAALLNGAAAFPP